MFRMGEQIGSYNLVRRLGRGTFGEVWLAEEKTSISTHKVALKLPNDEDIDLEVIRQEAVVWESVKGHPNILPIIKADSVEGQIYIASEYAPDGSLSEWLRRHNGKAPTVESAIKMIQGILSGLEHLHSIGVIHRDLKPDNILLQAETPRIADFGIARLAKATSKSTHSAGTPSYMAPECFYSIRSVQTDIWAVGVIFHLLLSGQLPFAQSDPLSVMNAIVNGNPQIHNDIPLTPRKIIEKALQKDTTQRYHTVREILNDLKRFNPEFGTGSSEAILYPTVDFHSNFNNEEETLVNLKITDSKAKSAQSNSSSLHKLILTASVLAIILVVISVWATLQFNNKESLSQGNISNSVPANNFIPNSNSTLAVTEIGNLDETANNNQSRNEKNQQANSKSASTTQQQVIPDGYYYDSSEQGTNPPTYNPPPQYVPPTRQYNDGDINPDSPFMAPDGNIYVVVPKNTKPEANTQPKLKTSPTKIPDTNPTLNTPTETKPMPAPRQTPKPVAPQKPDKPAPSGKQQDS